MVGNAVEIFHDQRRLLENIGVDFLNRIVQESTALVKSNLIGVVDMPFAARNSHDIIAVDMKVRTDIFKFFLHKIFSRLYLPDNDTFKIYSSESIIYTRKTMIANI